MTETVPPAGEFLLYQTEDGRTRVECRFVEDTLWLTQAVMAELYQKDVRTINEHLKNAFEEGELDPQATIRKFRIVRQEGGRQVSRNLDHYNLDAILAVGYRVRSQRGTQFRRWATERLREYLVKGFTLDDERLKNPPVAGSGVPDRFDELLERIRDIRASERRMYLRVREIFAMAADYSPSLPETTRFFQIIQNKLHFAVTGKTAPELIRGRADAGKPNMGLTSSKSGVVRKMDVTVAKNYLLELEISELNRIVVMWLDFAEESRVLDALLDRALQRPRAEHRVEAGFGQFGQRASLTSSASPAAPGAFRDSRAGSSRCRRCSFRRARGRPRLRRCG
jgi:hypothetical protein